MPVAKYFCGQSANHNLVGWPDLEDRRYRYAQGKAGTGAHAGSLGSRARSAGIVHRLEVTAMQLADCRAISPGELSPRDATGALLIGSRCYGS
jgi:hypothetical protein